jgi:phage-related protein
MDEFQQRALKNLRERHENKITQLAESIQEEIGYVLNRIGSGSIGSAGHYAQSIAADAEEIKARLAALEALRDAVGIFEATEG